MKALPIKPLLVCICVNFLSFGWSAALANGNKDLSDMDEGTRALLAKERARQQKPIDKDGDKFDSQKKGAVVHKNGVKGECDMQVGNNQPRPGNMNAKPQAVIITGPVIQNCK
jgi:hypothetical protein